MLSNVAGDDGVLDDNDKKMFVRYLGFPDTIQNGESLNIVPAKKGYDIFAGERKITNVKRDILEAYFVGREKY
jgi:hypothetical protein